MDSVHELWRTLATAIGSAGADSFMRLLLDELRKDPQHLESELEVFANLGVRTDGSTTTNTRNREPRTLPG